MVTTAETIAGYVGRAAALAPLIEAHAPWSQSERCLAPEVVEAFHESGLFRLTIPVELGGAGFREDQVAPVVEAVATADASAGWNLAIANGGLCMFRNLPEDAAAAILSAPRFVAAGTSGPKVRIRRDGEAYVLSGRGPFASGCLQSSWLVAIAVLTSDDGNTEFTPDGGPSIRLACIPSEKARIVDTWRSTGLRGTGSHDLEFDDVVVPAEHIVNPMDRRATRFDPLWHVPLTQRLGPHMSAVAVGAAARAVQELTALAAGKRNAGFATRIRERGDVQHAVGRARSLLDAARALLSVVPAEVFDRAMDGSPFSSEDVLRVRMACVTATSFCIEAVDLVNAAAGTSSLSDDSIIGRCWRDAHAVSQHVSQQPKHFEVAGRAALGLPYEMAM